MNQSSRSEATRGRIVAAAYRIFVRYGFQRATIGDIAREAGVSRPTVYAWFPGKEELFAAVVESHAAQRVAAIRAGVAAEPTLAGRLRFVCETWIGDALAQVLANPDAREILLLNSPAMNAATAEFRAILAEVISAASPGADAAELGHLVSVSLAGICARATSVEEASHLIRSLAGVVAAAVMTSARRTVDA